MSNNVEKTFVVGGASDFTIDVPAVDGYSLTIRDLSATQSTVTVDDLTAMLVCDGALCTSAVGDNTYDYDSLMAATNLDVCCCWCTVLLTESLFE